MGVTHKPGRAWLLDPLHLQQESCLCSGRPRHARVLSQVSLLHLSLGFYNACLQIRDPLSAAMHHCQGDSCTWFPRAALLSDLRRTRRSWKKNPSIGHLNLSQQIWCRSSVGELLVRWPLGSPPPNPERVKLYHYIMLPHFIGHILLVMSIGAFQIHPFQEIGVTFSIVLFGFGLHYSFMVFSVR